MNSYLLPMVKHFEGFYPDWYKCTSDVSTIGYGHTGSMIGLKPAPWNEPYASQILALELEDYYEPQTIEACAKVGIDYAGLQAHQQAALVSAVYNAGAGIVLQGTWAKQLVSGKPRQTVEQSFYKWNKSGGKTSPGLVRRRFAEMLLYWNCELNYEPKGWKEYYDTHR